MGFQSLAIEKRSSEVWKVLGAAKAEFGNYSRVWEKLSKKLDEAKNTVDQAGVRTRQIERKLRDVEALDPAADAVEATAPLLALPGLDEEDEAA
jgi:DNA recombination protein RmuC